MISGPPPYLTAGMSFSSFSRQAHAECLLFSYQTLDKDFFRNTTEILLPWRWCLKIVDLETWQPKDVTVVILGDLFIFSCSLCVEEKYTCFLILAGSYTSRCFKLLNHCPSCGWLQAWRYLFDSLTFLSHFVCVFCHLPHVGCSYPFTAWCCPYGNNWFIFNFFFFFDRQWYKTTIFPCN